MVRRYNSRLLPRFTGNQNVISSIFSSETEQFEFKNFLPLIQFCLKMINPEILNHLKFLQLNLNVLCAIPNTNSNNADIILLG